LIIRLISPTNFSCFVLSIGPNAAKDYAKGLKIRFFGQPSAPSRERMAEDLQTRPIHQFFRAMDFNHTQPMTPEKTVNFRCTCGALLMLNVNEGGVCEKCKKSITAKALNNELSRTLAIHHADPHRSHTEFVIVDNNGEPDLIGRSLGHFEIVEPLGRGGMGLVYRAFDTSLQRYVAVKVLSQATAKSSEGELDRLLQEAVAQARVNHPNIVSIYYVGKHDGNPFFAMELISGKTISERMSQGDLTFTEIVYVAWQICEALRFSYEFDVIHGDIKPSNILLMESGIAKLSDFGMARFESEQTDHKFGGTPNYLAPEILDGQKHSIQSDMYALGVTLYEMTFGKRPVTLSGTSIADWSKSLSESKISFPKPWPEDFPIAWQAILRRLLERDPAKRYPTYEQLAVDLVRVAPAPNVPARFLPRMIAAGIDHILVGTGFAVVQLLVYVVLRWMSSQMDLDGVGWLSFVDRNLPWYLTATFIFTKTLLTACGFIPIVLFTLFETYRRQSFGRALMHIRVVNQYGLRPSSRLMMGRSFLRMSVLWTIQTFFILPFNEFSPVLIPIISVAIGIYALCDIGYMAFFGNGLSLHDRWYKSRVVLDTNQQ
jgi:eukaryotic-like serine/threonine-protein kinase